MSLTKLLAVQRGLGCACRLIIERVVRLRFQEGDDRSFFFGGQSKTSEFGLVDRLGQFGARADLVLSNCLNADVNR